MQLLFVKLNVEITV